MEFLTEKYNNLMSLGDTRVQKWSFVETPLLPIVSLIFYSLFIWLGTKVMAKREPFGLKSFMMAYNMFQVVASFYIFYELLISAIKSRYSLVCQPVDYSNNELSLRMANALWMYYIAKIVDLIDTIVFVLRKKPNQVTFLHLFHHISMVPISWICIRFVPGGQSFVMPLLNCLVHTVMYAYYGLASMGPKVQKFLWWKRYLTQMQLLQFLLVIFQTSINFFSDCSYPKGYNIAAITYGITIMGLFLNFYIQSYLRSRARKQHLL